MNFAVIDLEFTQPNRKIIQIGAVTLDLQKGEIKDLFDEVCNPGEEPNSFISDLTGISSKAVREAPSLKDSLVEFWRVFKEAKISGRLASWGAVDIDLIREASLELGLTIPYVDRYNFKNMTRFFRSASGQSAKKGVGLKNVSQDLELAFEGQQHNALADARQAAKIMLSYYDQFREGVSPIG